MKNNEIQKNVEGALAKELNSNLACSLLAALSRVTQQLG